MKATPHILLTGLSATITIIIGINTIFRFGNLPLSQILIYIVLFFLFFTASIILIIKQRNKSFSDFELVRKGLKNDSMKSDVISTDWEIISHKVTLDITDYNGKIANSKQEIHAKRINPESEYYNIKLSPKAQVENVKSTFGQPLIEDVGTNLIAKIRVPLDKKQEITFALTNLYRDCFPSEKEFWIHRKIYPGGIYDLNILLPIGRPSKGHKATIYKSEGDSKPSEIMDGLSYIKDGDRSLIRLVVPNLEVGNEICITWDW